MRKPELYPLAARAWRYVPGVMGLLPKVWEVAAPMLSLNAQPGIFGVSNSQWLSLGIAWLGGVIIADITNPQSWLQRWWRWHRRYCDVKLLGWVTTMEEGDECQSLVAELSFVRRAKGATISLHIAGCLKAGVALQNEVIVVEKGLDALKGEKRAISIFKDRNSTDPDKRRIVWSDKLNGRQSRVIAHSRNVVTLNVTSSGTQGYRIYVQTLMPRTHGFPPIFYMGEDFDVLETAQGPAAP